MPMLEFGEWAPDQPQIRGGGLVECANVIPGAHGYRPFYIGQESRWGTLGGDCRGAISGQCTNSDGTQSAFLAAGTYAASGDHYIYAVKVGSLTAATPIATYSLAADKLPSGQRWAFAQFGDVLLWSHSGKILQAYDFSAASPSAGNADSDAPKAKYIATVGEFVVLGWTVDGPGTTGTNSQRVWWGGIGTHSTWETPGTAPAQAVLSDAQDLIAGRGEITGIVGGTEYGVVFQTESIWRMDFVGGDVFFQFTKLESDIGCLLPGSVIDVGRSVFFYSKNGWRLFDGISSKAIGHERIDRYFASRIDHSRAHLMSAWHDHARSCVFWLFPSIGDADSSLSTMLVYNYAVDRWSVVEAVGAQWLVGSYPFTTSLDSYTSASTMDGTGGGQLGATNLDAMVQGTSEHRFGAFASSRAHVEFGGNPMVGRIVTSDFELAPGRVSMLTSARVVADGAATAVSEIGSRMKQTDEVSFSSQNTDGFAGKQSFRSSGRYHRAKVFLLGEYEQAYGLDVEATAMGTR